MRALSDERLAEALDPGTLQRGVGYADDEMVTQVATLNRGRVVVAKVRGSGSQSYQTIVSQHSDPKDDVLEWSARCSCPVATDCKHAVAVILTVRAALGVEPGSDDALAVGVMPVGRDARQSAVARAVRLALHGSDSGTADVGTRSVTLGADTPYELGRLEARLHSALWCEWLQGRSDPPSADGLSVTVAISATDHHRA